MSSPERDIEKKSSDEDRCSEIFVDVEKGKQDNTESLSITSLYEKDNILNEHFINKLAL